MQRRFGAMVLVAGLAMASATRAAEQQGLVFESPLVTSATPGHAVAIDVDVSGSQELHLVATDGGDSFACDWVAWAEPRLETASGEVKLTELKWTSATCGFGTPEVNKNCSGGPLRIAGKEVAYGLGTHAVSVLSYKLPEGAKRFKALAGLDEAGTQQGCGSTVKFLVFTRQPPQVQLAAAPRNAQGNHDAELAVSQLDVAEGCEATLFASEPVLTSVANIDIDSRGRVWAIDIMNYRGNNGRRPEGDRILILEDTNGDGKSDKHTVYYQGRDIDSALGIGIFGNQVIVSCSPNVWVFTDENGDDKPDRKELLFTKVGQPQHDHSAHSFLPGPDGRLYWNFGNTGNAVHDKEGKIVVDLTGREVREHGQPYRGGMPFRCNLEGGEFETLAWNFRNNYEVTVDSFGTLWQSDNDDDGNRGVRINYVMEYGNFGYQDEVTGQGWNSPRTNVETEVPQRHWHLNDPGVVPNFVQTGAGSPTGICVYEGRLLPKVFWDQVIHADAGPSIVRAYPGTKQGAGYTGEIVNLLDGKRNNWFRPADVCVAPDGSLFVSDWYDPGVGGHGQRDLDRGRIFRVAPPGHSYRVPAVNVSTVEGAIAALKSPNLSTRYLGFRALAALKAQAEPALLQLGQSENPRERARALWLLARLEGSGPKHVAAALKDSDPDVRITALRAARQQKWDVLPLVAQLASDESAQVRRECALALRGNKSGEAARLWAELAAQHDGQDRWYVEAIGIGAEGQWDAFLAAFMAKVSAKFHAPGPRDVIWRSRAALTPELLAKLLRSDHVPAGEVPRLLRAFDFQAEGEGKSAALASLAFGASADPARQSLVAGEALKRLKGFDLNNPAQKGALVRVLESLRGTADFVSLVEKFNLTDRYGEVLALAREKPDDPAAIQAVKLLLARNQEELLRQSAADTNGEAAVVMVRLLGLTADTKALPLLTSLLKDTQRSLAVRTEAVRSLARFKSGAANLLVLAESESTEAAVKEASVLALQTSAYKEIREHALQKFPLAPGKEGKPLPPLDQLVKRTGNSEQGKTLFGGAGTCAKCHTVAGQGKDVGPDLSGIGAKLSRQALFESILYPSASIAHSFETTALQLADGSVVTGIVTSDSAAGITIKTQDAPPRTFGLSEVEVKKKLANSLMPADLHKLLSAEELIDVVEYLGTLKQTK